MNNGTPLSSSGSKMTSKVKKNRCSTFEGQNNHCYYLKPQDDAQFWNRSNILAFVISSLRPIFKSEVDRLSLQLLQYEMDRNDYPIDLKKLKQDIVVTLTPLTQIFNSINPLIQQFHIFRNNNINSFMIHSETKIHNWFPYILFTDLRKIYPERI